MNLIPAYGKVYKSKKEAANDWNEGKDFKIYGGPYCSIRDKDKMLDDFGDITIYWNYPNRNDPIII